MGTFAGLSVAGADKSQLATYTDIARATLKELETRLTIFNPASEISRLNQAAGSNAVSVSGTTFEVLELSQRYARISGGRFDATILPLMRLWGFYGGRKPEHIPNPREIAATRRLVGYDKLVLGPGLAARLAVSGMQLDLGGIAKGYGVDVCSRRLREAGATDVLINLGGNMMCHGRAAPDRPWTIGIRNPFRRQEMLGRFELADGMAVATSGNYERFIDIDGKRHAHILDPRTGFPVHGMAGVTVIGPSATEAYALSTALFVAGIKDAGRILAAIPECHALLVPNVQPPRLYATPGFASRFVPLPGFEDSVIPLAGGNIGQDLQDFSFQDDPR